MKNVKLFTHVDLDGISCYIVANKFYSTYGNLFNLSVTFCGYDEVNETISNFIETVDPKEIDIIYITDISVTDELAKKLDEFCKQNDITIKLLDHHGTALRLNVYDWAKVVVKYDDNRTACGTSLLFTELYLQDDYAPVDVKEFVEMVRLWDTYQFENAGDLGLRAKDLNYLFQNIPREDFIETMCCDYLNDAIKGFPDLFPDHLLIVQKAKEREDQVYNDAAAKLIKIEYNGMLSGWYFGSSYASQVCNRLCKANPELVFVAQINIVRGSIEFRTIRNDVNLGRDIASKFGGGGHPKAAGAQISAEMFKNILLTVIS